MRKLRKDKGKKRKSYNYHTRQRLNKAKPTTLHLRYDVDFAIRQKEQELGLSRNELINNALWTVFCNTKKFYEYEMQRHLMNAEVYRHKLEANRLSQEVKI